MRLHPRSLTPALGLLLLASCSPYPRAPETRTENVVDTLHGVAIVDPYRWLEDQEAPEVREWLDQQNAYADTIVGQVGTGQNGNRRGVETRDLVVVATYFA